jgi:hypothetical protein
MYMLLFLYLTLLTLPSVSSSSLAAEEPKDAILLSQVKSLILHTNGKTTHRRVPAVPQLTCNGPGCKHYKVDIMHCTNIGADHNAEDISWPCTASLPEEFKLGSTEVTCEGYSHKNDRSALKGRCAVEYRLLLMDAGEEKYGTGDTSRAGSSTPKGEGLNWIEVLCIAILYWRFSGYLLFTSSRAR